MNDTPFHTFIDLIAFDRAILAQEAQMQAFEKELRLQQDQEQQLNAEQETVKRTWVNAKKQVDDKELEAKDLENKELTKKKRIESVTNHREYQSLKSELDTIKEKQQTVEQEVLEAWHALEQAAKQYEIKKTDVVGKMAAIKSAIEEIRSKYDAVAAAVKERMQERLALEQKVPAEWLEKYAAMRSRVQDPVVPVVNGHCSACVYRVSDQDMLMLGRNKLLQCKDCYRFLYLESAHTSQPNS